MKCCDAIGQDVEFVFGSIGHALSRLTCALVEFNFTTQAFLDHPSFFPQYHSSPIRHRNRPLGAQPSRRPHSTPTARLRTDLDTP